MVENYKKCGIAGNRDWHFVLNPVFCDASGSQMKK